MEGPGRPGEPAAVVGDVLPPGLQGHRQPCAVTENGNNEPICEKASIFTEFLCARIDMSRTEGIRLVA